MVFLLRLLFILNYIDTVRFFSLLLNLLFYSMSLFHLPALRWSISAISLNCSKFVSDIKYRTFENVLFVYSDVKKIFRCD